MTQVRQDCRTTKAALTIDWLELERAEAFACKGEGCCIGVQ